jgi:hypothetical protein
VKNLIDNNKRIYACLRGFEQPQDTAPDKDNADDGGSKSANELIDGKFKNVEDLIKSYHALENKLTEQGNKIAELLKGKNTKSPGNNIDIFMADIELARAKIFLSK